MEFAESLKPGLRNSSSIMWVQWILTANLFTVKLLTSDCFWDRVGIVGAGEVYAAVVVSSQDPANSTNAVNFAVDKLQNEAILQQELIV